MLLSLFQRGCSFAAILLSLMLTISCQCSANDRMVSIGDPLKVSSDSIIIDLSKYKRCGEYVINDTLDLKQKTLYLPADIRLVVKKGLFKNGCVVGDNTHLKYKSVVFDRVHIKGTWVVPKIKSKMFEDLTYENALKDVFALANSSTKNKIIVDKGDYYLTALNNQDNCIYITNNSEVVINGNLFLRPNDFTHYNILRLSGDNISLKGNGSIFGDKMNHLGRAGEWGMGIYISGGDDITITGLTIKDCWGDCIYITKNSKNVVVENCVLENGRRQGISIISAQDVIIRSCKIRNISGTNPAYAIDVEPNKGDNVGDVLIENVEVSNCRGAFASYGKASDAFINNVIIRKCFVKTTEQCPLSFVSTKGVSVSNCSISNSQNNQAVECVDVEDVNLKQLYYNGKRINDDIIGNNLILLKNVKRIIIK